jgi:hypothetical protein
MIMLPNKALVFNWRIPPAAHAFGLNIGAKNA